MRHRHLRVEGLTWDTENHTHDTKTLMRRRVPLMEERGPSSANITREDDTIQFGHETTKLDERTFRQKQEGKPTRSGECGASIIRLVELNVHTSSAPRPEGGNARRGTRACQKKYKRATYVQDPAKYVRNAWRRGDSLKETHLTSRKKMLRGRIVSPNAQKNTRVA